MILAIPRSKMAYLVKSKNRPISRLKKKNVIKGNKNMKLTEVELYGTSRAENLYFTISMRNTYAFGVPKV